MYASAGHIGGWTIATQGLYQKAFGVFGTDLSSNNFKSYAHLQPGIGFSKISFTTTNKTWFNTYFGITTNSILYTTTDNDSPSIGVLGITTGSTTSPDSFNDYNYVTPLAHMLSKYAKSLFATSTSSNASGTQIYGESADIPYGINRGTVIDVLGNINMVYSTINCRGKTNHSTDTGIQFFTNGQGISGVNNTYPRYSITCGGFRKNFAAVSWDVFWSNISNWTSDATLKTNITLLSNLPKYDLLFDKLRPCRYQYINGESQRYHTGFIAQDIVTGLEESGLTTKDLAAVCLDHTDSNEGVWFMRRDELVALNTDQIQRLKSRVTSLEARIQELEGRLNERS